MYKVHGTNPQGKAWEVETSFEYQAKRSIKRLSSQGYVLAMTDLEWMLRREWAALQVVPSYVETQARAFASER